MKMLATHRKLYDLLAVRLGARKDADAFVEGVLEKALEKNLIFRIEYVDKNGDIRYVPVFADSDVEAYKKFYTDPAHEQCKISKIYEVSA